VYRESGGIMVLKMEDLKTNKWKWIIAGYRHFGEIGPEALNVEKLSMIVGLNRSSFYHYFGEVDLFEDALLKHHVDQFKSIGKIIVEFKEFQEMLHSMNNFTDEIKFHRQLLINEANPKYSKCFAEARMYTEKVVFKLWSKQGFPEEFSPKEFSLYQTVRDYFLLHYGQQKDEEVQAILKDIQLLMYGTPHEE